jgi:hypothetical protein
MSQPSHDTALNPPIPEREDLPEGFQKYFD